MYTPPTLTELIEEGKSSQISHRNFNNTIFLHDVRNDDIIKLPYNAIINKYRDFFTDHIVRFELTDDEKDRFWYKPKYLSYEYYGTVEYWSIILYINECGSSLEFTPDKLNLVLKEDIRDLVNEILIVQKEE